MVPEIGIVCDRCSGYAALGSTACPLCKEALAPANKSPEEPFPVAAKSGSIAPITEARPRTDTRDMDASPANVDLRSTRTDGSSGGGANLASTLALDGGARGRARSVEEQMDQAKHYVCGSCSSGVPLTHKFCGRCGAAVPPEILTARVEYFGQLQEPGRAKLILIRGEGVEGLSYQLNAEQHVVGKDGQMVFPDDPFVSAKHANFFYRDQKLVVRDEGSLNGVYIRLRAATEVQPGDTFIVGEQLFRVEALPKPDDEPGPDGTHFYTSPKQTSSVVVSQILQGGAVGMTVLSRGAALQIGREGGDVNFPTDMFMSSAHCKLEATGGKFTLSDLSSRNGTYVRLRAERELSHGDYIFIGKKLLRVEITVA